MGCHVSHLKVHYYLLRYSLHRLPTSFSPQSCRRRLHGFEALGLWCRVPWWNNFWTWHESSLQGRCYQKERKLSTVSGRSGGGNDGTGAGNVSCDWVGGGCDVWNWRQRSVSEGDAFNNYITWWRFAKRFGIKRQSEFKHALKLALLQKAIRALDRLESF